MNKIWEKQRSDGVELLSFTVEKVWKSFVETLHH